jgi:hypothetical protein
MPRRPITDDMIAHTVTSGTTTKKTEVTILYNDGNHALVKWPGGYARRSVLGNDWSPSHVNQVDLHNPRSFTIVGGVVVWNSDREIGDGPLTRKKLFELVTRLGLDPKHIRPSRKE